jgi:hypothetical protein
MSRVSVEESWDTWCIGQRPVKNHAGETRFFPRGKDRFWYETQMIHLSVTVRRIGFLRDWLLPRRREGGYSNVRSGRVR